MEKKRYIIPDIKIKAIEPQTILAGSDEDEEIPVNPDVVKPENAHSKGIWVWMEE